MVTKIVPTDAVLIPDNAERVFEGVLFDVYQWQQDLFDGPAATFEMLRRADTVRVVGVTGDQILVSEDVQPHRGIRRTFPGGRVDHGEDPLTAAKREVSEETGYEFNQWRLVSVWQPEVKVEYFIYIYLAWDNSQALASHEDGGENITTSPLPFDEVKQLVLDNVGYMAAAVDVFREAQNVEDLLASPEFVGKEIER